MTRRLRVTPIIDRLHLANGRDDIRTIFSRVRILTDIILVEAFKIFDVVFSFWKPDSVEPLKEVYDESDSLDDEEFLSRLNSEHHLYLPGSGQSIFKISENRVLKPCLNTAEARSEALAMEYVRAQTSIPVPRVRRISRHQRWRDFVVMDYIPNSMQLHEYWPSLSIWTKLKVILAVRYYLRQLRQIRDENPPKPGPLGPQPSKCKGLQFTNTFTPPFRDVTTLMQNF